MVLVIDDSLTFRECLREVFEEADYGVTAAASGAEGLRLIASLRPDLVIIDQQMPEMDGLQVLGSIRADAALRGLPCLMLTASSQPGTEIRALEAGADDYVFKDGDLQLVLAKAAALLRSPWPKAVQSAQPASGERQSILAVDDSFTYLSELADQLRQEGYKVVCASSGAEAMAMLPVHAVDAILLDMVMPGLSGTAVCQWVKAQPGWRDIPLLMVTALSEHEALIEGINSGADDFITKSIDFGVLKARLKAQLRRRPLLRSRIIG